MGVVAVLRVMVVVAAVSKSDGGCGRSKCQ